MKIVNIIGARPQFMKYFPVQKALENLAGKRDVENILIHTGQHYDYGMSKIFFDEIGIRAPEYHLGAGSGNHGQQTSLVMERVESILLERNPDKVLVYGDTNSTLGGSLAASKLKIPVAHIEAGLRSYNKFMPEEMNRIVTDHLSTFLFCPSQRAIDNLLREGLNCKQDNSVPDINSPLISNTGDIMYDMLLYTVDMVDKKSTILESLSLKKGNYCLLTMHRAENVDNPERFKQMISYINETFSSDILIFPMHPRTKKNYEKLSLRLSENILVIDPVGYFDITRLLKNSKLLITDSGGMQKEAYWLKVPCVTLREETEWTETVESGWNILYREYRGGHKSLSTLNSIYGNGKSAEKIIKILLDK